MKKFDPRKHRLKLGMTQKEMSDFMAVSEQTIRNWEAGRVPMNASRVAHMKAVTQFIKLK